MSDLGQTKSSKTTTTEVNYFWKKYDFRNGRTFAKVHSEHPYCQNPIKSCNQLYLLFHLGDAYFFVNELTKTTATSPKEAQIFNNYLESKKKRDAKYGKLAVASVTIPYFVGCFLYRGIGLKVLAFYTLLTTVNATYDCGMYIGFWLHGPKIMRELMSLDHEESFSPI